MSKSQKKLKWHPVICKAIRKKQLSSSIIMEVRGLLSRNRTESVRRKMKSSGGFRPTHVTRPEN